MLDNWFSKEETNPFLSWLEWAGKFVILTHQSPDGDAVGSSLALYSFLKSKGKNVTVITPDSMPDFLKWLPSAEEVLVYNLQPAAADKLIDEADVICCLDFNSINRIGAVASAFIYSKAKKILIDHHLYPASNFDITLSRPLSSATSELVFHLLCAMGEYKSISQPMAECIYTGMMTDTGAFTYNSNSPRIYTAISLLLEKGIDKDGIYRKVFYSYTESRMRLIGYALSEKMKLFPECSAALITLTSRELKRFKSKKGDTEGLVNMPFQIQGVRLSCFLREDVPNGVVKVSLRSIGSLPCNILAQDYFNGGGHKNASGGELELDMDKAVAIFHKALSELKLKGFFD